MVSPDARSFDAGEREEFHLLEAVREDGPDVTSEALLAPAATLRGSVVARQPCRVAGLPPSRPSAPSSGSTVRSWSTRAPTFEAEAAAAAIEGNARKLLGCERILLNFLSRLSGVATLTRRYADDSTRRPSTTHPQDHAGLAAPAEVRGEDRRRPESPAGPRRPDSDQGQPFRRPRGGGGASLRSPRSSNGRGGTEASTDGAGFGSRLKSRPCPPSGRP